jgi:beta-lactamase class A
MKRTVAFCLLFALAVAVSPAFVPQDSAAPPPASPKIRTAPATKEEKLAALEVAVHKKVKAFRGEIGLVIRDLDSGWALEVNPERLFPAASMVKVPIMAACLKAAEEGRFSLQDDLKLKRSDKARGSGILQRRAIGSTYSIEELVELMVTRSDNTATNMLIDLLGFNYLNQTFKQIGLQQTVLSRKMMDFRSREKGIENFTSAREMADILELIYRKGCVCSSVSEKSLEVLKSQKINDRIPRLLPRNTVVAHKTGLERQVCHDAGIVFTENGNFLISIFTKTTSSPITAKRLISNVSSLAYTVYKTTQPKEIPTS